MFVVIIAIVNIVNGVINQLMAAISSITYPIVWMCSANGTLPHARGSWVEPNSLGISTGKNGISVRGGLSQLVID